MGDARVMNNNQPHKTLLNSYLQETKDVFNKYINLMEWSDSDSDIEGFITTILCEPESEMANAIQYQLLLQLHKVYESYIEGSKIDFVYSVVVRICSYGRLTIRTDNHGFKFLDDYYDEDEDIEFVGFKEILDMAKHNATLKTK